VNFVGLTVKFAVTAEEIKKSAIFNGVTSVAPPLPWSFFSSYSLHLFPPHSLLSSKSLNKTKKMNQTFPSLSSSFNPAQEKKCVNIKETENKKKRIK